MSYCQPASTRPAKAASTCPQRALTRSLPCRRQAWHRLSSPDRRRFGQTAHRLHTHRNLTIQQAQKQQFSSFDDMIQNSQLPVLVDFYATWCGPCQIMSQVLSKLSTQMAGKIQVVKIDTDKYPKVASRYAIQALPTLLVFQNGRQVDRIEGDDAGRMCMNGQLLADRLQYLLFSKTAS